MKLNIHNFYLILALLCTPAIFGAASPEHSTASLQELVQAIVKEIRFPKAVRTPEDLQTIIAKVVPSNQLEATVQSITSTPHISIHAYTSLGEELFNLVAPIIAKAYFLGLPSYNEKRSPELLPDWLRTYFKGVSIQDLVDNKEQFHFVDFGNKNKRLDLTEMYINDLTGLKNIPGIGGNIQDLDLSRNLITTIEPSAFPDLPYLETLGLNHNQITTIPSNFFASFPQLKRLSLGHNRITTIETDYFAGSPHLRQILLYNNQVTVIKSNLFLNLPELSTLNLDNNLITIVKPHAFDLPKLRELSLINNQITTIVLNAFAGLPQLEELNLQSNKITVFEPQAVASLSSLQALRLRDNPITGNNEAIDLIIDELDDATNGEGKVIGW